MSSCQLAHFNLIPLFATLVFSLFLSSLYLIQLELLSITISPT